MALNQVHESADKLSLPVASGKVSGDPVLVGQSVLGVALTNRSTDISGEATVKRKGGFTLSVKGVDDLGNVAGAIGDPVFFTDADTPELNFKRSGQLFGVLLGAVGSGATASVEVALIPSLKSVVKVALLAGGAAGAHVLTGIAVGDRIATVLHISTAAAIATMADITAEFVSIAADAIDNTGGTDTTNDQLLVIWIDHT